MNYIPANGGATASNDNLMKITVASNNRPMLPSFEQTEDKNIIFSPNLKRLSTVYKINPMGFELSNSAILKYNIAKQRKNTGFTALFEWIDNKWRLLPGLKTESSQSIAAKIDHFATYAVFADGTPPTIKFQSPKKNYAVLKENDTIICKVHDDGVGIAYKSVTMSLNGNNIPAEYRLDTHTLFYQIDNSVHKGNNLITVSAKDRLGNNVSKEIWFVLK